MCLFGGFRAKVGTNWIYVMVDETTDYMKKKVVNVLIGILNGENEMPYLISSQVIESGNTNIIDK